MVKRKIQKVSTCPTDPVFLCEKLRNSCRAEGND